MLGPNCELTLVSALLLQGSTPFGGMLRCVSLIQCSHTFWKGTSSQWRIYPLFRASLNRVPYYDWDRYSVSVVDLIP